MTVYGFRCDECGHEWDQFCYDKEERHACPDCKANRTRRVVSRVSVRFSGSGWTGAAKHARRQREFKDRGGAF